MARKKQSESRQARQFGVILIGLLGVLATVFHFWSGHSVRAIVALSAAGMVALLSLLAFPLWLRLFRLWMKLANILSVVMSTVVLTLFFYIFFTPIVLVVRVFGKMTLDIKWKDGKSTYWIDKSEIPVTMEQYEKQF